MSKHLLSFLLSELTTVRVICKGCGVIVELPIHDLGTRFREAKCPLCNRELLARDDEDALRNLDNAILAIKKFTDRVEIEFVMLVCSPKTDP
jgi:hypothetical protein